MNPGTHVLKHTTDNSEFGKQDLVRSINDILGHHGYKKKGLSWISNLDEVIRMINLQKSSWSEQYYLNIGIFVRDELPAGARVEDLKESLGHIRMRGSGLRTEWSNLTDDEIELNQLLDLSKKYDSNHREQGIRKFMLEDLIPFLDKCETFAGLSTLYREGRFARGFVHADIKGRL